MKKNIIFYTLIIHFFTTSLAFGMRWSWGCGCCCNTSATIHAVIQPTRTDCSVYRAQDSTPLEGKDDNLFSIDESQIGEPLQVEIAAIEKLENEQLLEISEIELDCESDSALIANYMELLNRHTKAITNCCKSDKIKIDKYKECDMFLNTISNQLGSLDAKKAWSFFYYNATKTNAAVGPSFIDRITGMTSLMLTKLKAEALKPTQNQAILNQADILILSLEKISTALSTTSTKYKLIPVNLSRYAEPVTTGSQKMSSKSFMAL